MRQPMLPLFCLTGYGVAAYLVVESDARGRDAPVSAVPEALFCQPGTPQPRPLDHDRGTNGRSAQSDLAQQEREAPLCCIHKCARAPVPVWSSGVPSLSSLRVSP